MIQMRETVSLDGAWAFRHARDVRWRTAQVPQPWQAEFADLRQHSGRAVYKRTFSLPKAWRGREIALQFGAVSYWCEVKLNGVVLGAHEGGYLPFEFVLPTDQLRDDNELEVSVVLPDGNSEVTPEFPFAEIPHGKQSWYGPIGGIWQSVVLEARDARHLEHVQINADISGEVKLVTEFSATAIGASVELKVRDGHGAVAATLNSKIEALEQVFNLRVNDPQLWSPDQPNLYLVEVNIGDADATTHSFGFRKFETRDGKFWLNDQPFYMRGALDQDYYPEGICTPPSLAFLEDQLGKAKALGLNLLRCHIKVPDPRYCEVADRLGMLIWTEIPNVATFTEKSAQRMRDTMEGILRRDFNHPSIVIWTLINEDWGTRVIEDASHRQWLKDTYDWLKALDPTRLVVDNSACHSNFHVKSDINDYHYYRSVPERRAEWDKLTEEFAMAADWTYSKHGDAEWRGDEPLVVSEFGVWGLPHPDHVKDAEGLEPWWMETGVGWGDGAATPHGIQIRYATYGLDSVFGSFDNFIAKVQWWQFANLKYQIESMRARESIQGYVITEFTDVHWESNGLLDMNRNPRAFHDAFPAINSDVVIVPKVKRYSGWSGSAFNFDVAIATGGANISSAAILIVTIDGVEIATRNVAAAQGLSVLELGAITIDLPHTDENRMARFVMRLVVNGEDVASNHFEIGHYAKRNTKDLPTIATSDAALAKYASALGYEVKPKADVVLARGLDASDITTMQDGARYLVLADGHGAITNNLRTDKAPREQPFMPIVDDTPGNLPIPDTLLPNILLHQRQGTLWRGDWIANFSWIRRDGAFATIPGGPLLDLSFDRVVPYHVMTGFRPWEFGGSVCAGLVVGWVHKPAVTIGSRRVGDGGLVATTFRLLQDPAGEDPVAATLFDALVATAAGLKI